MSAVLAQTSVEKENAEGATEYLLKQHQQKPPTHLYAVSVRTNNWLRPVWQNQALTEDDLTKLRREHVLLSHLQEISMSTQTPQLHLRIAGFRALYDRLRLSNESNPKFRAQYAHLIGALCNALEGIRRQFGDGVYRVLLADELMLDGVDLRELQHDTVLLDIWLRSDDVTFEMYQQMAVKVFNDLDDSFYRLQFRLISQPEWRYFRKVAIERQLEDRLGIPLMSEQ